MSHYFSDTDDAFSSCWQSFFRHFWEHIQTIHAQQQTLMIMVRARGVDLCIYYIC